MSESKLPESTITPEGNITLEGKDKFRDQLKKAIEEGAISITLDFSNVELIDSTGVGVVVAACNSLKGKNGSLAITNTSEDIQKMFKIMRLDRHMDIS